MRSVWASPLTIPILFIVAAVWLPAAANKQGYDLVSASVESHDLMLLLGVAAYLTQALDASRPQRHNTTGLERSAPAPRWARELAHAVALASFSTVALLIEATRLLLLARSNVSVGEIAWWEVVCSAFTIILAGMLGRLVGSYSRSLSLPLAAGAVLAVMGLVGYLVGPQLGPWLFGAGLNPFTDPPLPYNALGRATWGRTVWLACASTACLIWLAAEQSRRTRTARKVVATGLVLILGATFLLVDQASSVQAQRARFLAMRQHPGAYQTCTTEDSVTYCVLPGFNTRISQWSEIITGISSQIPQDQRSISAITVAQYVPNWADDDGIALPIPADSWAAETPSGTTIIPVSTRWSGDGSGDFEATAVAAFAIDSAYTLATGDSSLRSGDDDESGVMCGSLGAVVLFLARNATDDTHRTFDVLSAHSDGAGLIVNTLDSAADTYIGLSASALADAMDRNPERIQTALGEHWDVLTSPDTSAIDAARLLGVDLADLDSGTICER